MARVTEAEVREIITLPATLDITAFIAAGNVLVTARCAPLGYADAELKEIERWLSAHFASCEHSKLRVEVIGLSREEIVSKVDLGLKLTHHGQQALALDYLGGLAGLGEGSKKKIKITWLGDNRNYRRW